MTGNVWEWTASAPTADYSKNPNDGFRVLRGGGWLNDNPSQLRSARRVWNVPAYRFLNLGMRCALSN